MSLNDKRKLLELSRITLSKQEQEFRIEELLEEINRIKENLKIQTIAIEKLNNEIKNKDVTNG